MAKMSQEVQAAFNGVMGVAFSTVDAAGQPNTACVAIKKIIDDETIYLSDQFFKKTFANLQVSDKVSVAFWGEAGAYQIHGTARYVNEGEEFAAQKAWADAVFQAMGKPVVAKGGCFITVDAVYQMAGGPTAGDQLA